MHWDKDNNNDKALPARHPREPAGLRQDILDEIADHLASAAEREQERGSDNEGTVRHRVLEQFGDPDVIARKLWWDQMRETVMRECIQTGVMVVVAVAVVVFMGVAIRQMNAANQTVLEALRADAGAASSLVSFEVAVTRGSEDGEPAEGVKVQASGAAFGPESSTIVRNTGAYGAALFGPMQPGSYALYLQDSMSGVDASDDITVFASETDVVERVIAPAAPREDSSCPRSGQTRIAQIVSAHGREVPLSQ